MLRPCLTAVLVVAIGCVQPEELVRPDLAKSSSGPTVTATDPPFGRRGDQGAQITITGTGFDNGSRASWERNGSTDPKVNVRSTTFVSSTQLVATVDIATDASLSLYDVAVTTTTGRKGIGTAKFEVTQAEPIAGTESAFGVNENGEVAGRIGPPGAFYWSPGSGLLALGTPGRAYDLSEDGQTVAGFTGVCCDGAFVQEYDGAAWQYTRLPRDPAASYHAARVLGRQRVDARGLARPIEQRQPALRRQRLRGRRRGGGRQGVGLAPQRGRKLEPRDLRGCGQPGLGHQRGRHHRGGLRGIRGRDGGAVLDPERDHLVGAQPARRLQRGRGHRRSRPDSRQRLRQREPEDASSDIASLCHQRCAPARRARIQHGDDDREPAVRPGDMGRRAGAIQERLGWRALVGRRALTYREPASDRLQGPRRRPLEGPVVSAAACSLAEEGDEELGGNGC
jgi:hypothetical protein